MADAPTTLRATDVTISFGALKAVDGMSLDVAAGECVGLIGPNGAGKSTLLNLLSGYYRPDSGVIHLHAEAGSRAITRASVPTRARLGVGRIFQTPRLVPELSARENVELGWATRGGFRRALEATGLPGGGRLARTRAAAALDALDRVGLADRAGSRVSELSLGQQRLVEFARGIASDARILLLDEPFAGLARRARGTVADLIHQLRDDGIGVLLVEHDLAQVRRLADRLVVMDHGGLVHEGPVDETLADPEVIRVYIGDIELDIGGAPPGASVAISASPVTLVRVAEPAPEIATSAPAVLEARAVSVFYGSIPATHDITTSVAAGDALGLVGPNGAGKSTLLRGLAGLLPSAGTVVLHGDRIDRLSTPRRYKLGLGFVPQTGTAVADLTVRENLRLSWLAGTRTDSFDDATARVFELFPEISTRLKASAGSLSGGQRQMLAIGRGLAAGPTVLLLDEPSAGLAPALVAPFADALRRLRASGIASIMVEHNLGLVRASCSHVQALRAGHTVWSGPTAAFDDHVAEQAFLGHGDIQHSDDVDDAVEEAV